MSRDPEVVEKESGGRRIGRSPGMSNDNEIRWRQRYESFSKAIALLGEALEAKPIVEYSRLE